MLKRRPGHMKMNNTRWKHQINPWANHGTLLPHLQALWVIDKIMHREHSAQCLEATIIIIIRC